jgi:hypothetical protein
MRFPILALFFASRLIAAFYFISVVVPGVGRVRPFSGRMISVNLASRLRQSPNGLIVTAKQGELCHRPQISPAQKRKKKVCTAPTEQEQNCPDGIAFDGDTAPLSQALDSGISLHCVTRIKLNQNSI